MTTNIIFRLICILIIGTGFSGFSQNKEFEDLKMKMLENNNRLKSAKLNEKSVKASEGEAFTFRKTQIYHGYEEADTDPIENVPLNQWGIQQTFDFPTLYTSKLKLNKVKTKIAENRYNIEEIRQIKSLQVNYQDYLESRAKLKVYDSIYAVYSEFAQMAKRKYEEGESNYLEKITAESKASQIELDIKRLKQNITSSKLTIKGLLQVEEELDLKGNTLPKLELQNIFGNQQNLSISALDLNKKLAEKASAVAKQELLPGFSAGYFIKKNTLVDRDFYGYQVGLNFPLLFFGNSSKIKSARINELALNAELEDAKITVEQQQNQLINQLTVQEKVLQNFEEYQLKVSKEILKVAKLSYKAGEIDFFRYSQSIENAQRIQIDYLSKLRAYNQTVISINYFLLN